jgi:hypothetical protein
MGQRTQYEISAEAKYDGPKSGRTLFFLSTLSPKCCYGFIFGDDQNSSEILGEPRFQTSPWHFQTPDRVQCRGSNGAACYAVSKCWRSAYLFVTSRQCKSVSTPPNQSMAEADLVREARQGGQQAFLVIYH